jgi:hypothetical protein
VITSFKRWIAVLAVILPVTALVTSPVMAAATKTKTATTHHVTAVHKTAVHKTTHPKKTASPAAS